MTVITGANGSGKSNFYKALSLMQRMAEGRFAENIAAEGGLPSVLWAGESDNSPKRVCWEIQHDFFHYTVECGLNSGESHDENQPSRFKTDPEFKKETLAHAKKSRRVLAKRRHCMIEAVTREGELHQIDIPFFIAESMLSEVRDADRFPAISAAREIIQRWRFYHHFRVDQDSPIRRPQVGFRSPILAHDGANLATTLATIQERNDPLQRLDQAIAQAFPDIEWYIDGDGSGFELKIVKEGMHRSMDARELSDGTLRFFCLCAALLSPSPPELIVLNEPETSLHPGLLSPLAELISMVPETVQIILVTHSTALAKELEERCDAKVVTLSTNSKGATVRAGDETARRVWHFGD